MVTEEPSRVRRYIEETGLPFNILVDRTREVVKTYDVWHRVGATAWNLARPALFVIDRDGRVRYSFVADHQREFPEHAEIVEVIDAMLSGDSV